MIKISSRDMEAIIEPKGAYLYSLKKDGKNVILEGKERQTRGGMAILVPFANRVKGGHYRWNGKEYSLPLNKEGNAIHGLVMDKVFSIENKRDDAVSLATDIEDKGYPVRLHVNVKYNIASGLTCEIEVKNEGDETAPLTVGTHPYFIVKGMWSILPNTGKKCITNDKIPTGEMVDYVIDFSDYDCCFLLPGDVTLFSDYSKVKISKPGMDYLQIYTGIPGSVALEPMSGIPDAFNNGIGLTVLSPGQSKLFRIEIYADPN